MNRILSLFFLAAVLLTGCKKSAGPPAAVYDFSYNGTLFTYEAVGFQSTAPDDKARVWLFGDGTSSTNVMPVHTYSVSGTFTVKMIMNGDSTHVVAKEISISSTTGRMALSGMFTTAATLMQNQYWPIDHSAGWYSSAHDPAKFVIDVLNDSTVNVTDSFNATSYAMEPYRVVDSLCNDSLLVFTSHIYPFLIYDHKNDHIFFDFVNYGEGGYKYRIQSFRLR